VRSNRRTSLETSLFSLAWPLRRLTSRGTKTLGPGLDGGHPGREGRGDGGGVRDQVHAVYAFLAMRRCRGKCRLIRAVRVGLQMVLSDIGSAPVMSPGLFFVARI
jgi:hypothetical protein